MSRRIAIAACAALLLAACGRSRPLLGSYEQCDTCHGAPPATGAHLVHVAGSALGPPVACATCHVVPAGPGHPSGAVRVTFGPVATHGGATAPVWSVGRCSATYCHGATLAGGSNTAPVWTGGPGQATCGSCHGIPPPAPHPDATGCGGCHPGYSDTSVNLDLHVNGAIDGPTGAACGACHAIPPATGAHRVHATPSVPGSAAYGSLHVLEDVAPAGAPGYDFGCGNCHPLDPASHFAHVAPAVGGLRVPDVFLDPAGPSTSLRARNLPDARYDPTTRTCSGVACHSSGRDPSVLTSTDYATTPPWDGPPGALGCAGCHRNPPRYASGGAGTAGANSHLVLGDDGWESGHFQGLPGYWHTSKHGGNWSPGEDAAPITCQTCHAGTVDPAATGPSGFYWLDTTGDYRLPGSAASGTFYQDLQCTTCHDGARAAAGAGKVLPLRHVNGRRDVAFDVRTTLPAIGWLPAAPSTPTRPYWVTDAAPGVTIPDPAIPDAVFDGTTLSLHLASARYDPATKTCTSVACHLAQTSVTWGAPHGWSACGSCHGF